MIVRIQLLMLALGLIFVSQSQAAFPTTQPAPKMPQTNGVVHSVIRDGDTIYAGGDFSTVTDNDSSQVPRNDLVAINASTGKVLPWNPTTNGTVYALVASGNNIFVGGNFGLVNSDTPQDNHPMLVAINKTNGQIQGPRFNPTDATGNISLPVYALARVGNDIFVGGSFTRFANANRPGLAAITSTFALYTNWAPTGFNGTVYALSGNSNDELLYVGGDFTAPKSRVAALDIEDMDEMIPNTDPLISSWTSTINNGTVRALHFSNDNDKVLFAGGSFTATAGALARNNLAPINPTSGLMLGNIYPAFAVNGDVYALASMIFSFSANDNIYVAGSFTQVNGTDHQGAFFINRASKTIDPWNPQISGTVHTISTNLTTVYIGGLMTQIGGVFRNNLAAFVSSEVNPSVAPEITASNTPPRLGGDLRCGRGTWLGEDVSLENKWYRGTEYFDDEPQFELTANDNRKLFKCEVTASNMAYSVLYPTADFPVRFNLPPVMADRPIITGEAMVGRTLSCSVGTWTEAGAVTTDLQYAYQWGYGASSSGVNTIIPGAIGSTYTVASIDAGKKLACRVTARNVDNIAGEANSLTTLAVAEAITPVNTKLPYIELNRGTGVRNIQTMGATLFCNPGSWSGRDITYSYTWQRNGVNVAVGQTYLLTIKDWKKNITCEVAAVNSVGITLARSIIDGPILHTDGKKPLVKIIKARPNTSGAAWAKINVAVTDAQPSAGIKLVQVRVIKKIDRKWCMALKGIKFVKMTCVKANATWVTLKYNPKTKLYALNTKKWVPGKYAISVRAADKAENLSATQTVTANVTK